MLIAGIDPHKNSHTAAALDSASGEVLGELTIAATREGYRKLAVWLTGHAVDLVAIENVRGLGRHLADWLRGQGFPLVDIATKEVRAQRLARRGGRNKNDPADALAAAQAAATGCGYRIPTDELGEVSRLLTEERDALNVEYLAKRNRLHAHLRVLRPGGAPLKATVEVFANLLKGVRATTTVLTEVKRQARGLLADMRRLKRALDANRQRIEELLETHEMSLLAIPGFGPVTVAGILGAIGDIARFASQHQLAAFAGAAPKQIASGAHDRHRLDRLGNPQLNRSIHTVAIVQARLTRGPGREYYLKKTGEGKTHREAIRCLKRQLIKLIWRHLRADARQRNPNALTA